MPQIGSFNFMGTVMKRAQFGNAPLVNVETNNGNPGARECSCDRQSDVAKPDDCYFTPMCHE